MPGLIRNPQAVLLLAACRMPKSDRLLGACALSISSFRQEFVGLSADKLLRQDRPLGSEPIEKASGPGFFAAAYLRERIHCTTVLMSASFRWGLGGIGMSPHTPLPPAFTLWIRLASAPLSLR